MSNVTLTIGGRGYAVACDPGEEAQVARLGAMIDAKLSSMGTAASQGETRNLLFAALLLADEVHELKRGENPAAAAPAAPPSAYTEQLEAIARRLENCASALEA